MEIFENPKRILIIKLGALGDVMMAEGVMRCIRQHYPKAHITLMTEPLYARFMNKAPHFDEVLPYKRVPRWHFASQRAVKTRLKSGNYDLVIDLQNSSHSRRFQSWLQDAFISSTSKYADIRYHRDASRNLASREYLREQVETIGVDMSAGYFSDLTWAAEDVSHVLAQHKIKNAFALLVAGSAARHPQKRWPGFPALVEELAARNIQAVTAPGPDEHDLCAGLPAIMLMDGDKFLTLGQLVGLASHCEFVVGNDTGPTHMLAAAHTKGVALFGSNHSPAANTGIGEIYQIVEKPTVKDISVPEVLAAIDRL
ncbi:MAG: glycosyltransferase family 9 protein [Parvibaculales bacterium]|jgi:ADP-heptose:LPS heptosyltransferase